MTIEDFQWITDRRQIQFLIPAPQNLHILMDLLLGRIDLELQECPANGLLGDRLLHICCHNSYYYLYITLSPQAPFKLALSLTNISGPPLLPPGRAPRAIS